MTRRSCAMVVALWLALWPQLAAARPGGGHTYSGGSSHSYGGGGSTSHGGSSSWSSSGSGSYGSGGNADPMLLFIVIVVLLGVAIVRLSASGGIAPSPASWSSDTFHAPPASSAPEPSAEATLAALRTDDPDFSRVLFDDFVHALVTQVHAAKHDDAALALLAPYLADDERTRLARRRASEPRTRAVVIGAVRLVRVRRTRDAQYGAPPSDWVRLAVEANLVQEGADGAPVSCYLREEGVLRRALGVRTRPWKGARTLDCPNCAAPAGQIAAQRCAHCGELVEGGRFDWVVHSIEVREAEPRPPSLTGTTEEVGTQWPTVFAPTLQDDWRALTRDDPAVTVEALAARLQLVYDELTRGWNAQDPRVMRPWLSDGQLAAMVYWLDAYRAQGLRNVLAEARCRNFLLAKVVRDRHYDAVTLRLWADGLDYTLDAHGRVVGGSRETPRAYSEYWTFIRGAGVRGAPRADRGCPNCGAALATGMGSVCEHCGAAVTRGEFDWVLSKIEQDEAYAG